MGIGIWNIKICNSLSNNDQCNEKRLCICEISQFSHKAIKRLLEIDGKLKYDKYALINGSQESCKLFSF